MNKLKRLMATTIFLGTVSSANATLLTDGTFSVNIDNDLEFNLLSLNGIDIDDSSFVQQQYINGFDFDSSTATASAISVFGNGFSGAFATYSTSDNGLDVVVTSTLLGSLLGFPNTGILEQVFQVTNTSNTTINLSSVSYIDQDLDGNGGSASGDTVAFDPSTDSVYAFDDPLFMAAIATGGVLGWDLRDCCDDESTFGALTNPLGSLGPNDTEMYIGLDYGSFGSGESATLTFRYLVGTNGLTETPSNFSFGAVSVPEPGTLGLVAFSLLGLFSTRRTRR